MTFRPADDLTLTYGMNTVSLRPSLRAGYTLERAYSFPTLFDLVDQFHLDTIRDIIKAAATDRKEASDFLRAIANAPLADLVDALHAGISSLCRSFILPDDNDHKPASGKPMTWQEVYRELYRTATGLGWSPETAWSSTPYEIQEAYEGHMDILEQTGVISRDKKPDTYTPDRLKQIEQTGTDPAFDRDAFSALRAQIPGGA
jgi:hypothetical protein